MSIQEKKDLEEYNHLSSIINEKNITFPFAIAEPKI